MAFDMLEEPEGASAPRGVYRRTRFDWNAERIALLRQRWAEGASASAIGRALGVSRCAILGKVHRLKLAQPEFKRQHPDKVKARRRLSRALRPRAPRPRHRRERAPSALLAAFAALGLETSFALADPHQAHQHADTAFGPACSLLELGDATCRWPVGDPGRAHFAFCGAAPFRRYPYCLAHCLIAYRPDNAESATPSASAPQALRAA